MSASPRVAWIDDPGFESHLQDASHPESPERVRVIREALSRHGLTKAILRLEPRKAEIQELELVHDRDYILEMEARCKQAPAYLGEDVVANRGTWSAALLAAGSALAGAQAIVQGRVDRVFVNARPPGHHARRSEAMGFCIFNNVALAARWASTQGDVKRVAILDWDVHHGNGSQEIFWDDPKVFYASMQQHPHYPGSGFSRRRSNSISVALEAGSGDERCLEVFERELMPALEAYEPELLLISCGFDALEADPLGGLSWSPGVYGELTRRCLNLGGGRILSLLEGGYALPQIGLAAVQHVLALLESEARAL